MFDDTYGSQRRRRRSLVASSRSVRSNDAPFLWTFVAINAPGPACADGRSVESRAPMLLSSGKPSRDWEWTMYPQGNKETASTALLREFPSRLPFEPNPNLSRKLHAHTLLRFPSQPARRFRQRQPPHHHQRSRASPRTGQVGTTN
jgi:hypothetical protein